MANADSTPKIRVNTAIKEPPLYRVIYVNDDKTSMEFVIDSLIEFFGYDIDSAPVVTMDIHEKGSAVVAVLPFEIAEQRGIEVTLAARAKGYPLVIKVEADTE